MKHSVDWLGVGTLAGWVSFLLLGFLNGGTTYPWYSWEEAFFFAGFTVLFPIFLLVETRSAEPILPLRLFKNRTISSVFIVQFLRGGILLGLIVFISVFVQGALRGTIDDVRNVIWAFVIPAAVGSIFSGRIVSRFGYRIVTLSGLILTAVGGYFLATIGATPSVFDAIIRAPLMGLGLGISIASVLSAFQNSVERRDIGIASSLSTFSQNLGGAVVVGILGTIQLNSLTSRLASMAATPQLRQAALEGSITDVFLALFIMTLIAALASLFVSNPKKAQS